MFSDWLINNSHYKSSHCIMTTNLNIIFIITKNVIDTNLHMILSISCDHAIISYNHAHSVT